ncbi:MAG: RluA family pseudouridine synthase [Thermoguttaceae bacterium]
MNASLLDIIHEDAAILVVNKPSGLLTQAPLGIDSLEHRVKSYLKSDYLGVPHRLDRPTSGVIIFGKQTSSTRKISLQFERRTSVKTYWALLEGVVAEDSGTWRDYIRKLPDAAKGAVAPPIHPDAREAVLHFRTVHRADHTTLLEIELETGRMHQIRVQAASRSFPLVGDVLYGATTTFGDANLFSIDATEEQQRERPIALHARTLTLDHPQSRERMTWCATLPAMWEAYIPPEICVSRK